MIEDKRSKEKREFTEQQKEAKKEIRSLRVSVAHIHLNLHCYQVLLFVAYHRAS
jgi:hypothetical protein